MKSKSISAISSNLQIVLSILLSFLSSKMKQKLEIISRVFIFEGSLQILYKKKFTYLQLKLKELMCVRPL